LVADIFDSSIAMISLVDQFGNGGKQTVILEGAFDTEIEADERHIDQVMLNLLNNAVKYAPDSEF